MKRAIVSWSGGKDSCYALQVCKEMNIEPVVLLSAMNEDASFTRSNGVPKSVLQQQASALNLPVTPFPTTWERYEDDLIFQLNDLRKRYNAEVCVFGDIDLLDHKKFEEEVCAKSGLSAVLPLWGESRETLAYKIIHSGIKARISVIRKDIMSEKFLGVDYDEKFLSELKKTNIDLCGENGEFHTLVYGSPLFSRPIFLKKTEKIYEIENCKLCVSEVS